MKTEGIEVRIALGSALLKVVVIEYGKPTRAFKEEYHLSLPILESKHGKTQRGEA